MSTVIEIENAIRALPHAEFMELAAWMDLRRLEQDDGFDRRIEADAKAGRLARMAEAARAAHRARLTGS
jgi:hypothetical protein